MDMAVAVAVGMGIFSEEEESEATSMKLYLQVRNQNQYRLDLRGSVYGGEEHKWYVVERDADDASAVEIRGMTHNFSRDTASVCVNNSTVYVIGGRELRTIYKLNPHPPYCDVCVYPKISDLWCTDTYIDGDDGSVCARGWFQGASMTHPRSEACAVSLDGKIYVFGGVPCPSPTTWAEVYDIEYNRWSLLAVPSPDMTSLDVSSCVVLDFVVDVDGRNKYNKKKLIKKNKKLILVYISELGSLHSYDAILGNWELFDSDFGHWATDLVLVSSASSSTAFLFTIMEGILHGYHLGQRKWFPCPVSGLEGNTNALPHPDSVPYCHDIRLVSLGNGNANLFVLWSTNTIDHSGICVHCTNLTVYEEDCPSSLAAKVESTNVFKLDNGDDFICCLALVRSLRKKRAGQTLYMEEEKKIKH